MRRVLLVGTSFSAAPLLETVRTFDVHVAVCGNRPSDPCVPLADAYFEIDYADPEALLRLVDAQGISYVCPSCNDDAYRSACWVAERRELPGYDSTAICERLQNKALFRAHARALGLRVPYAVPTAGELTQAQLEVPLPVLVKPAESWSGRGMTKVLASSELAPAVALACRTSRTRTAVIEEFVEGTLHSHSAFVHAGKVVEDVFVDEFCGVYPYQVDGSHCPSRLDASVRAEVRDMISRLIEGFGLCDGLLHTQFLAGPRGVTLVECMRRCPGDLYYRLVERSTGRPYRRNYVAPFVGEAPRRIEDDGLRFVARHTVSFADEVVLWSITSRLPVAVEIHSLFSSAACIGAAPYDKAAIMFAELPSEQALREITPRFREYLELQTSPGPHARRDAGHATEGNMHV